ncbi:MAG: ABC transporter permease subunit, partial [Rhodospirillales bacterium]
MSDAAIIMGKAIKPKTSSDDWIMRAMMLAIAAYLLLAIALPLYAILSKSFQDPDGMYIGLTNYITYLSTPALTWSIENSFKVTFVATVIVLFIAFIYSYALTRSCMPFKKFFKGVALIPLLMPSLLPAIALVFFFGNQGVIKEWLFGYELYGPIGIVMGEVFFVFPHVMTILLIGMSLSDARLYEASEVLGASKIRTFFTVTLPSMRYGLVSAFFVAFTLVITDFGVPKVVGGQYNVLATDVYKQVVGRHDFQMGAVVAMALLLPAAFAFIADRLVQRKQVALLSARAVPFEPKPSFT